MNTEEIKILLNRTFKNLNNPLTMGFLNEVVKCKYGYSGYPLSRAIQQYRPIVLKDNNLVVEIKSILNEEGTGRYHQVGFDKLQPSTLNDDIFQLEFKAYPSEFSSMNFSVKDGIVRHIVSSFHFIVNPDFTITSGQETLIAGLEFDIVNKTFTMLGNAVGTQDPVEYSRTFGSLPWAKGEYKMNPSQWELDVNQAILADAKFAKAAEECTLLTLLNEVPYQTIIRLYQYITVNSVKHVLHHSYLNRSLMNEISRNFMGHYNDLNDPRTMFAEADDAYGVLGINGPLAEYSEGCHQIISLDSTRVVSKMIDTIRRLTNVKTADDICKIAIILGCETIHNRESDFAKLLFVLERGYTLEELYSYLALIDKKQAVIPSNGLTILHRILNISEALTGCKKKMFPKYLKGTHDVFERNFRNEMDKRSADRKDFDDILANVVKKRSHLCVVEKDYEIYSAKSSDSGGNIYGLLTASSCGEDVVIYKKKRGKNEVLITIEGNNVTRISEKLNEVHEQNVRDWAAKHNLWVTQRNLYR